MNKDYKSGPDPDEIGEKLKQDIEIKNLREAIQDKDKALKEKNKELRRCKDRLTHLQKSKDSLSEENKKLNKEKGEWVSRKEEISSIEPLKSQLASKEEECGRLNTEKKNLDKDMDDMLMENESLKQENAGLREFVEKQSGVENSKVQNSAANNDAKSELKEMPAMPARVRTRVIICGCAKGDCGKQEVESECRKFGIMIDNWYDPDKNDKRDWGPMERKIKNNNIGWVLDVKGSRGHFGAKHKLGDMTRNTKCTIYEVKEAYISAKSVRDFYHDKLADYKSKAIEWFGGNFEKYVSSTKSKAYSNIPAQEVQVKLILKKFKLVLTEYFKATRKIHEEDDRALLNKFELCMLYLINPIDIIPESEDPIGGLIDDMYIFCGALNGYYTCYNVSKPDWFDGFYAQCRRLIKPKDIEKLDKIWDKLRN